MGEKEIDIDHEYYEFITKDQTSETNQTPKPQTDSESEDYDDFVPPTPPPTRRRKRRQLCDEVAPISFDETSSLLPPRRKAKVLAFNAMNCPGDR